MEAPIRAKNLVDNQWVEAEKFYPAYDPATGKQIGEFAVATKEDGERAIDIAYNIFEQGAWGEDRHLRARALNELADLFEEHQQQLIEMLSLDNGKVLREAAFEVGMVAPKLRFYAAAALTQYGRSLDVVPGRFSYLRAQPLGVAGVIVPWNSPVVLAIRSIAPALAAGCTCVVKLPAQTALINHQMMQVFARAKHLPRGVIHFLTESGSDISRLLVDSPKVATISYTGSTATGRQISANAAQHLKRVGHELGGKTPFVVFEGADIDACVDKLTSAATVFAGQFCMTASRLLVHRNIADQVLAKIGQRLDAIRVGSGQNPDSDMGPLIDKPNVDRVNGLVEEAIAAGAKVLVRGGPVTEGEEAKGAFYRPTLLLVDNPEMAIFQQEVFGPVLTACIFDDVEQAISLANNSEYGLAASLWSQDVNLPHQVARRIDAGTVWINDWAIVHDEFEEGGFKQSGIGRLNGLGALEDFIEYKHISQNMIRA